VKMKIVIVIKMGITFFLEAIKTNMNVLRDGFTNIKLLEAEEELVISIFIAI
jgi:hypothetical protein